MKIGNPPLVTVFGGGGFVGRYVCEYLLRSGARVRVAQRHAKSAYFLQPLGQVGQIQFANADVIRRDSVALAVSGADAVVNLVSVFGRAMQRVNGDGAGIVAEETAKAGAGALVQVSAIGADPNGPANYAKSKATGEAKARTAFPKATIIRPSLVFGPEDQLTNRFASLLALLPTYPVIAPNTMVQPVYVRDLGKAIATAALEPNSHGSKTYEIGGPDVMTMRALTAEIGRLAGQDTGLVDMPDLAAKGLAKLGFLPGAPISWDQWLILQRDNVTNGKNGLAAFGIEPMPIDAVAGEWLERFREGGRFAVHAAPLDA